MNIEKLEQLENEIFEYLHEAEKIPSGQDIDDIADINADDYDFQLGFDIGKLHLLRDLKRQLQDKE